MGRCLELLGSAVSPTLQILPLPAWLILPGESPAGTQVGELWSMEGVSHKLHCLASDV